MINPDVYKPLKFFRSHTDEINTGFTPFSIGNTHYFAYYFGRKLILMSQGYKSIPGRDNGIESVKTNMRIKGRYKFHQDEASGKYYFDLIAGNYQGVARSAWFKSELVARAMANILIDEIGSEADEPLVYHPEAFFDLHINGVPHGFDAFEVEGGYYFTYNQNDKIILMSQAQTTASLRDALVDKVRAHMQHEEWYEYRSIDAYQHDFRIVDVDDHELARSVVFGSEAAADKASLRLQARHAEPIKTSLSPDVSSAVVETTQVMPCSDIAQTDTPLTFSWQRAMEGVFKWAMIALFGVFIVWTFRSYLSGERGLSTVVNLGNSSNQEQITVSKPEIICWDESRVSDLADCPPQAFTLSPTITSEPKTAYICSDGRVVKASEDCP